MVVLLPHVLRATVIDTEIDAAASGAVLRLSAGLLALGAGCVLGCHWWITHNRGSAWVSAVTLAIAVESVPFALVSMDAPITTPTTMLDSLVHVPFVVLLMIGAGGRGFRRRVGPILLGLSVGLACLMARTFVVAADLEAASTIPSVTAWTGRILAGSLGVLAIVAVAKMSSLPRWARSECVAVAVLITLAEVIAPDDMDQGFAGIVGGGIQVAGFLLLAVTAAELLLEGIRDNDRRLLHLAARAHAAEQTLRNDEEVLHEVRGSVAGISSASRILMQLNATLNESQQRNLADMLRSELDRLEHLLRREPEGPRELVRVDPVVVPLVSTYENLGLQVQWEPSGVRAWTRREDLATILHVLLSNTARHAPGSRTWISAESHGDLTILRVADDGPGIPDHMRARLFDRGVRSNKSDGQGLGLFIAQKIVADHGGTLDLADPPGGIGAAFEVQLPAREPA